MDWLSDRFFSLLEAEWQAIVDRAAPGARAIWRSGGLRTEFLNDVEVRSGGSMRPLNEMLTYHDKLAAELHAKDRVHTYGSFYIADIAA
jgi:S-adenosylmethionine-diacylglycerol 3-amino-3-carboxypropyl transferase